MAQQKLDLALKGLYTSPNNFSAVPQGALEMADDVVIDRINIVESRRGQTQYGEPLDIDDGQINKLFNYASSLVLNYGDQMAYDAGSGNWMTYAGTYLAPSSDYKMRSLEALRNFYFTTTKGIYKIDRLTATPRPAGVVEALSGTYTLVGSSGFLVANTAVAYRLIWAYTDANNNLLRGAPSQRMVVANPGPGDFDVQMSWLIPDTITGDYVYQIYRSVATATSNDEPSDELQLVLQGTPTPSELTAKVFTITDTTPYNLMRETLYTSPSQEGIENANYQPPRAIDMDLYKGSAFYANVKQKQQVTVTLIAVGDNSDTFGYSTQVSATTVGVSTVTVVDSSFIRVGMRVVGAGIQADSRVTIINSPVQITMSKTASATGVGVSLEFQDRFTVAGVDYFAGSTNNVATNQFEAEVAFTPGDNIDETALNLIQIINTSASNTLIYAYYLSGVGDLPGQILFKERSIGGSDFYITGTGGASWTPNLPLTGTTISSSSEEKQNRVYISKTQQIEAVPLYSYFDIGSANFPIQRVVALRDGIFFFKQDGVFRISGESFSNYSVTLVDNTVTLKVPESAVPFNNQVFCFTTQGICAITDAGAQIMSVPIEATLMELSSDQYTNFVTASFGVAYESSRQYLFFTVTEENDQYATQAFIYNSLTNTWTRWIMDRTCGVVNTAVNKLFMAQTDTGQVLVERKSFTVRDYADEQYAVEIVAQVDGPIYQLTDASLVVEGMTMEQDFKGVIVAEVDYDTNQVTLVDDRFAFVPGEAIVYTPIVNKIQWAPIDVENPGILKQFSEITLAFRNAAFQSIEANFRTNVVPAPETVDIVNNSPTFGWGQFGWGLIQWGGELGGAAALRTYVPRNMQRASWIYIGLETREAFTGFSLQGISIVYNTMSTRFR